MNNLLYTRKYLKKLDKELEMQPLYRDDIFKRVFIKNLDILKKMLICVLKLPLNENECNIYIQNAELTKSWHKERKKTVDVYVILNEEFHIFIEVNSKKFNDILERNRLYIDKARVNIIEKGTKENDIGNKQVYQLNLNIGEINESYPNGLIYPYDIIQNKIVSFNTQIHVKSLEYFKKLYYTNSERNSEVIWLAGMAATSFTELYDIYKNILTNEELNMFIEEVIKMSSQYAINIHEWEKEKLDHLVKMTEEARLRKEGKEETVINMLNMNMGIDTISKASGLTEEEILKIKEQMEK